MKRATLDTIGTLAARVALAAIILAILLFASHSARSQEIACAKPSEIAAKLATGYQESVMFAGITTTGHLLRVYIDPKDGGWTLSLQSGFDRECVQAAGDGARQFEWRPPTISN